MHESPPSHEFEKSSGNARQLYEQGLTSFVQWRADAMFHLDKAIEADEEFVAPKLVKAWMLHSGRDAVYQSTVKSLIDDCQKYLDRDNVREVELLSALKLANQGMGIDSATVLESILQRDPTDILSHRLIQFELFWSGRSSWMYDVVERAASAWHDGVNGYGAFLSMRAFANEEYGCYAQAERYGRQAVAIDVEDVWGAHAVAHVLVMQGHMQQGANWLENLSSNWGHANQLRHHLWWHYSLFLLELGEHDRVLELLLSEIRNPESPLVQASPTAPIDLQNFASLLLRLEIVGVNVGDLWSVYAEICADRVHNQTNAFINAHDVMVLAATDQFDKAHELIQSIEQYCVSHTGSVATAYHAVGLAVCKAILAHRKKQHDQVLTYLLPVRHDLHLMGASHTQRDVFYQLLMDSACQQNRSDLIPVLLNDIERIGFHCVTERVAYRDIVD